MRMVCQQISLICYFWKKTAKFEIVICCKLAVKLYELIHLSSSRPRSAVGNVSDYRCVSDCRSRGREFDPGPVPYFHGDWSWNNCYGHSPPFRWFIQEGLLSVTSKSMCMKYWLTACSSLPRKKSVVRWTDRPLMCMAVAWDIKQQTKPKKTSVQWDKKCNFLSEPSFSGSALLICRHIRTLATRLKGTKFLCMSWLKAKNDYQTIFWLPSMLLFMLLGGMKPIIYNTENLADVFIMIKEINEHAYMYF